MEAPRGAREPTGTNGPTPHQPPQPGTQPPKRSQHRNKEGQGAASPRHRTGASTGGAGNQTPPAGPASTGQDTATRGGTKEPQPLYEPRPTHPPPNPPHNSGGPGHPATRRANKGGRTTQSCGGHSTGETPSNIPNLEAKPGRANGTAPQGVWESRKPPQHTRGGAAHTRAAPHTHPHARQTSRRARARQTSTRARPRNNAGTHPRDHAGTHTRATSADPTPTTPTRERAPAHTSPTHALRRAPGRPIAPALLPA